jgi:hypothetical protein
MKVLNVGELESNVLKCKLFVESYYKNFFPIYSKDVRLPVQLQR